MKRLIKVGLGTVILVCGMMLGACSGNNAPYSAQKNIISASGTITGYNYDSYFFEGKKGQQILLNLASKGNVEAVLYGYDDFMVGKIYVLPKTDKFEIRVLQPRALARKGISVHYDVLVKTK